ncbi:MAG TPA: V-type ATP synthase subunit D [Candidatus Dormibacteraeota bacterium]|nr:V-type ATP synthase subunit D [Candidatus Dormibacteraeota bacterium]
MRLRHPPGRSGRLWLGHRLAVAQRGVDLLDKKRRVLMQEERRLRVLARDTAAEWDHAAREAEVWLNRAAIMAGEEKLSMLAAQHPVASVAVHWRSSMGVVFAAEVDVDLGPVPDDPSGGSAAADLAVSAYRRALSSAVKEAAARSALIRISRERDVTARRQRAVERRWVPALAEAAARLDGVLDEMEREEATRALWVRNRNRQRGR